MLSIHHNHAELWDLDPEIAFLNHGSFGACPRVVLEEQARLRARMERQLITFFVRDLEALIDESRTELATFLGARPEDLAFVPNATTGVNSVLRSLQLEDGDQLLTTDHAYGACANTLRFVAKRANAEVVVADLPYPLQSPDQVVEAVLDKVTDKTRFFLLDHITSPTGLVLPAKALVDVLESRGVQVLIDGAHCPGMIDLDLESLGASYYTGNCHKWLCTPKGSAFLWVRRDLQEQIRPTVISHGATTNRADRSRYLVEFDWTGTVDPTPYLCVGFAIRYFEQNFEGGWGGIRARNRALALHARDLLCAHLAIEPPAPNSMIANLAAVPIPDDTDPQSSHPPFLSPLQEKLLNEERVEVPVIPWPAWPKRLVRFSSQLYLDISHATRLVEALESCGIGG